MAVDEATHLRNKRLWADTGTKSTVLMEETPDGDSNDLGIDDIYVQAAEKYPDDTTKQDNYARVIVFSRLLAPSALQGRYVQNQSEEDLTKVFDHLESMLTRWEKRVAATSAPAADTFIGGNFFGVACGRRGR